MPTKLDYKKIAFFQVEAFLLCNGIKKRQLTESRGQVERAASIIARKPNKNVFFLNRHLEWVSTIS